MKRTMSVVTLLCGSCLAVSLAAESFSLDSVPKDSPSVSSQGQVLVVINTSRGVLLKMGNSLEDCLQILIPQSELAHFPDNPRVYYRKRFVRVSGTLDSYRGFPELVVLDPSQLVIVDPSEVVPPMASVPDATQLLERISRLENIVRELSRQMTELQNNMSAKNRHDRVVAPPNSELLMNLNKRVRDIEEYLEARDARRSH